MPKGMVELEPGRFVAAVSPEYKAWIAANPDKRKAAPRKPKPKPSLDIASAPVDETFSVFELPLLSDSQPSAIPDAPPAPSKERKGESKSSKQDDYEDIVNLTTAIYAGAASLTGDAVWLLSNDEANAIARPLNNILKRNPMYNKMVRQVADPLALFAAVALPTSMRFAMWQQNIKSAKQSQKRHEVVQDVTKIDIGGPPPPPQNGYMEDVLSRISMA